MMRLTTLQPRTVIALIAASTLLALIPATAASAQGAVIVRFATDMPAQRQTKLLQPLGATTPTTVRGAPGNTVVIRTALPVGDAVDLLDNTDGVVWAQPDRLIRVDGDPSTPLQWGLDNWGQNLGQVGTTDVDIDALDNPTDDGSGVIVGVVDSGMESGHEDLQGVQASFRNLVNANTSDERGHGTHVSGTIAERDANGLGGRGVATGALIATVKVFDASEPAPTSRIVQGIYDAAAAGARVINLSLGATGASPALLDAANALPGVLLVASAGNDNTDASNTYPCSTPASNLLCVAALDNQGYRASFSNYGPSVDLWAPGKDVYSTVPGGYAYKSGTSMAAPHVAGIAARALQRDPGLTGQQLASTLRAGTKTGPHGGLIPSVPKALALVPDQPQITTMLTPDLQTTAITTMLTVRARRDAITPRITWQSPATGSQSRQLTTQPAGSTREHTTTITDLSPGQAVTLTATAGSATATRTVTTPHLAPRVSDPQITTTTLDSLRVTGTITGGSEPATISISLASATGTDVPFRTRIGAGETRELDQLISGLQPDTEYRAVLTATGDSGPFGQSNASPPARTLRAIPLLSDLHLYPSDTGLVAGVSVNGQGHETTVTFTATDQDTGQQHTITADRTGTDYNTFVALELPDERTYAVTATASSEIGLSDPLAAPITLARRARLPVIHAIASTSTTAGSRITVDLDPRDRTGTLTLASADGVRLAERPITADGRQTITIDSGSLTAGAHDVLITASNRDGTINQHTTVTIPAASDPAAATGETMAPATPLGAPAVPGARARLRLGKARTVRQVRVRALTPVQVALRPSGRAAPLRWRTITGTARLAAPDGRWTLLARIDASGPVERIATYRIDTKPPQITITRRGARIHIACNEPSRISIRGHRARRCAPGRPVALPAGAARISATDAANNGTAILAVDIPLP